MVFHHRECEFFCLILNRYLPLKKTETYQRDETVV